MDTAPLAGRLIAVPESRELDVFAGLLERRGAQVLRCPLVEIVDAPEPAPVERWLRGFAAGHCDDLILLTGEGVRRLVGFAGRPGGVGRGPFLAALGRVRRITRGPKPARALRELGLAPDLEAVVPTTAGVIETLGTVPLLGRRVGIQLYGAEPNERLMQFLLEAGAVALPVAPYRYADAADEAAVRAMLERIHEGQVAAIAFTAAAQIARLERLLPAGGLAAALDGTQVVAVGPIVAQTLRERGVRVDGMPEANWSMKPLATELCRLWSSES